jgi:hypothetical protein
MQYVMLNKTDQEHVLSELQAMPDFLEASFKTVSLLEAAVPGSSEAFSPVEHCWHLADLEREGYAVRIRSRSPRAFRRSEMRGSRILQSFGRLMVGIGMRLGEQDGVGAIALCDIPAMMAEHDADHRREIEEWKRARDER